MIEKGSYFVLQSDNQFRDEITYTKNFYEVAGLTYMPVTGLHYCSIQVIYIDF